MKTEKLRMGWKNVGEHTAAKEFVAKINVAIKRNSGTPIMFIENLENTTYTYDARKDRYQLGVAGLVYHDPSVEIEKTNGKVYVPLIQRYNLTFGEKLVVERSESQKIEIDNGWIGLPSSKNTELERSKISFPGLIYPERTVLHGAVEVMVGEQEVRDYFLLSKLQPGLGDELFEHLNRDRKILEDLLKLSPEERKKALGI